MNVGVGEVCVKDFVRYGFNSSSAMSHFIKRATGFSLSELKKNHRWHLIPFCGAVLGFMIAVAVYFASSRTISIFQNPEALAGREAQKPSDSTTVQIIQISKDTVENQQP